MQKLTIKFEHEEGSEETTISREDIIGDDMFWDWFIKAFESIGLGFVSVELKERSER